MIQLRRTRTTYAILSRHFFWLAVIAVSVLLLGAFASPDAGQRASVGFALSSRVESRELGSESFTLNWTGQDPESLLVISLTNGDPSMPRQLLSSFQLGGILLVRRLGMQDGSVSLTLVHQELQDAVGNAVLINCCITRQLQVELIAVPEVKGAAPHSVVILSPERLDTSLSLIVADTDMADQYPVPDGAVHDLSGPENGCVRGHVRPSDVIALLRHPISSAHQE